MKARLLITLFAISLLTLISGEQAYAISGPVKAEAHLVYENVNAGESQALSKKAVRKAEKLSKKIQKRLDNVNRSRGDRSFIVALLLSIFFGLIGVDRFYLGYIGLGILKLLTFGGFGIWYLIDIILIAVQSLRPKNGEYYDI